VRGRALRHPPGWIALDLAKRIAEKIGDLVISHPMEIAILKADCSENNWHHEADGLVRCLAQRRERVRRRCRRCEDELNRITPVHELQRDPHRGIDAIALHPPISTAGPSLQ
jgi:hypothetical protein